MEKIDSKKKSLLLAALEKEKSIKNLCSCVLTNKELSHLVGGLI